MKFVKSCYTNCLTIINAKPIWEVSFRKAKKIQREIEKFSTSFTRDTDISNIKLIIFSMKDQNEKREMFYSINQITEYQTYRKWWVKYQRIFQLILQILYSNFEQNRCDLDEKEEHIRDWSTKKTKNKFNCWWKIKTKMSNNKM